MSRSEQVEIAKRLLASKNDLYRELAIVHGAQSIIDYKHCEQCDACRGSYDENKYFPCETLELILDQMDKEEKQDACGNPHSSLSGGAL